MDWNAILTPALGAVAIALAGAVGTVLVRLINAGVKLVFEKIQEIKDHKTRSLVWEAFERVKDLVNSTVAELEQTGKQVIEDAIADGKIEDGELSHLGEIALEKVYSQLKDDSKELLATEVEDVKAYIVSKIEEAVLVAHKQ